MSKNFTNSNDQWLIKSAGRILGPFKLTEVLSGLQLKHFSVMDEISMPYGRWVLIRDEVSLQEALKTLRKLDDVGESTMTLTATSTRSVVFKDISDSRGGGGGSAPPHFPLDGRTGRDNSLDVQMKAMMRKRSLMMRSIVVFLLIVIAALGFFVFKKNKLTVGAFDELTIQLSSLKNQGLFERALDLLNRAKLSDKNNLDIDTELALIQVGFYRQTVVARRTLEKSVQSVDDKNNGAAILTGIALTYLHEGDWKNANDMLQKAIAKSPLFYPALFNKAVLNFKSGQFENSEKDFEIVIPKNGNDGDVILSSTLSSLEVARKGLMPVRILPVLNQMLDEYLKTNFAYEQELLIIQSYINNQLNKPKESALAIQKLLSGDLESGKNHKSELLFDRSLSHWKNLISYCQTVYESSPSEALFKSLWAYCNYRNGNDIEAKKIIDDVSMSQPTNPFIQYLKAYLLSQMGQLADAKASLNVSFGDQSIKGNSVLKAKFCEKENNDNCALETYAQAIEKDPRLIYAYFGLAKLENKKGNKKAALDWINRGLSLSNTFIPLWDLKFSIGK